MNAAAESSRVLVVGDGNLDLILQGDIVPSFGQHEQLLSSADLVLGSSAGITAVGLSRLGMTTALLAVVGDDELGAMTMRLLRDGCVDVTEMIVNPSLATGISVALSGERDRAILTFVGAMASLNADAVRASVRRWRPDHVHFASYFLLPELALGLPSLLSWLKEEGIGISLDTNADPSAGWEGVKALLPHVDVFFPNARELAGIAGLADTRAVGLHEAAIDISQGGPLVVVTDGEAGAFAATPDGTVRSQGGFPTVAVDTTGAGDSFTAGFLSAMLRGADLGESLAWGCAAGALAVQGRGGTAAQADAAAIRQTIEKGVADE